MMAKVQTNETKWKHMWEHQNRGCVCVWEGVRQLRKGQGNEDWTMKMEGSTKEARTSCEVLRTKGSGGGDETRGDSQNALWNGEVDEVNVKLDHGHRTMTATAGRASAQGKTREGPLQQRREPLEEEGRGATKQNVLFLVTVCVQLVTPRRTG